MFILGLLVIFILLALADALGGREWYKQKSQFRRFKVGMIWDFNIKTGIWTRIK